MNAWKGIGIVAVVFISACCTIALILFFSVFGGALASNHRLSLIPTLAVCNRRSRLGGCPNFCRRRQKTLKRSAMARMAQALWPLSSVRAILGRSRIGCFWYRMTGSGKSDLIASTNRSHGFRKQFSEASWINWWLRGLVSIRLRSNISEVEVGPRDGGLWPSIRRTGFVICGDGTCRSERLEAPGFQTTNWNVSRMLLDASLSVREIPSSVSFKSRA